VTRDYPSQSKHAQETSFLLREHAAFNKLVRNSLTTPLKLNVRGGTERRSRNPSKVASSQSPSSTQAASLLALLGDITSLSALLFLLLTPFQTGGVLALRCRWLWCRLRRRLWRRSRWRWL